MYSMVLMMALGGGAAPADHHGCVGCAGWACHGGGGCYASACHGGGHRLFGGLFRGHGCHGGGWACHGGGGCHVSACHGGGGCYASACNGCHGGGHKLFGGLFRRHGCHGCNGCYASACHGCHGAAMYHGCHGCAAPQPPGKPMPPPGEPVKPPKKSSGEEEASARTATLVVSLPEDARLTIDDNPTTSTSGTRVFVTPELDLDTDYQYTLKAEVVRDGQTLTASKQVTIRAGSETRVSLELTEAGVASR